MKECIRKICNAVALGLGFVLFLGALGGYEDGNYGFTLMLFRLAVDALIIAIPGFIGYKLKDK